MWLRIFLSTFILCCLVCGCDSEKESKSEPVLSVPAPSSGVKTRAGEKTARQESKAVEIQGEGNHPEISNLLPAAGKGKKDGEEAKKDAQDKAAAPLAPEERERANKILEFSNQAINALSKGYFTLPEKWHRNSRRYAGTWRLPKSPRLLSRAHSVEKMTHPRGIFDEQEEKALTEGLREMNSVAMEMFDNYKVLEKYVADDSIRDDGKQGLELAAKLEKGHAQFIKARDSWLEIVEANAARAEEALLRGHPLRRQIFAASRLFSQFSEISRLLKMEEPDKSMLEALSSAINANIADAEKPPFNSSPALERLYRAFLRAARQYENTLRRGISEGLFTPQKNEIIKADKACRILYNKFAMAANFGR